MAETPAEMLQRYASTVGTVFGGIGRVEKHDGQIRVYLTQRNLVEVMPRFALNADNQQIDGSTPRSEFEKLSNAMGGNNTPDATPRRDASGPYLEYTQGDLAAFEARPRNNPNALKTALIQARQGLQRHLIPENVRKEHATAMAALLNEQDPGGLQWNARPDGMLEATISANARTNLSEITNHPGRYPALAGAVFGEIFPTLDRTRPVVTLDPYEVTEDRARSYGQARAVFAAIAYALPTRLVDLERAVHADGRPPQATDNYGMRASGWQDADQQQADYLRARNGNTPATQPASAPAGAPSRSAPGTAPHRRGEIDAPSAIQLGELESPRVPDVRGRGGHGLA